jgi:hypothetical protein
MTTKLRRKSSAFVCLRNMKNVYKILVGILKRSRSLTRPRHRWEIINKAVNNWAGFNWFRILSGFF